MDEPPDEWGWWQDAAGKWHPPGVESLPRQAPEQHQPHRFQHAEVVHPKHHRAGAGDYTVKPVVAPPKGLTTILTVIMVALGSVVVVGGLALLAYKVFIEEDDDAVAAPTPTTLSVAACDRDKLALQEALLLYKAANNADAPDMAALVPEFLPSESRGWSYTFDGTNVNVTARPACS